jgi:hypothetical protein
MFPAFDDFNPKFIFFSPVRSAAVDKNQLPEHVDHAIIALDGRAPIGGGCCLEQLEPVTGASTLRVELWVNDLDDYTCTYGFLVSSENGRTPYARGERTVVSLGWSSDFRHAHEELRKDLPAYA